jgi:N-acylglucosamine-6-phosphate 2-epimerase
MPTNLNAPLNHYPVNIIQNLSSPLIVSCQAPVNSPLHNPYCISAMAQAAINQGAAGIRIDTPSHIQAVRTKTNLPIIGLWKQQIPGYEVYITPRFSDAQAIAEASADIIAIDATSRPRPDGETVANLITRIHNELGKPVMADIDTLENALMAVTAGADILGTTLYGYTPETKHLNPPGFSLLTELVQKLEIPVICEGGIATPEMAQQALKLGADAVVVGTAITGVDSLAQQFHQACISV